jgi:hypothetical protein
MAEANDAQRRTEAGSWGCAVDATTLSPGLTTVAGIGFVLVALVGLWLSYVGWRPKRRS